MDVHVRFRNADFTLLVNAVATRTCEESGKEGEDASILPVTKRLMNL